MKAVITTLDNFGKFSSLEINYNKCEAAWLGPNISHTEDIGDIKWVNLHKDAVKILGIWYTYNGKLSRSLNCGGAYSKIKRLLNSRPKRALAIVGRNVILKHWVSPKYCR